MDFPVGANSFPQQQMYNQVRKKWNS